jgi:hypothetical protein
MNQIGLYRLNHNFEPIGIHYLDCLDDYRYHSYSDLSVSEGVAINDFHFCLTINKKREVVEFMRDSIAELFFVKFFNTRRL